MRGIHVYERHRLPRPTRLGWLVCLLILLGGLGVGLARAEPDEPVVERFTPSARGTRPAVTRWRPLLAEYPWDVETALRVVDCESGGDPGAINPSSGAAGLMQLYGWSWLARRLFGTGDVTIPWVNVAVAHVLWADSGGAFGWYDARGRPRGHWAASIGCWS